ncbi:MAG TPA: ribosome maturation factor RimM [Thermomicrobiaceae bacterium]|nr:ribosome maturation factor RimM [Thermomicrobiaceae bacterium]
MTDQAAPGADRLSIGVIVGTQGLQGQVKMQIWSHFPERIPELTEIYLDDEASPRRLERAQVSGGIAVLKVQGIDDRNAAEELRGTVVRIPASDAAPLAEDEYFHFQLIGLPVFDEAGTPLGELAEILETGANDVYIVRDRQGRDLLLPALKSVVLDIDLERRRITVRPPAYLEE